MNHVHRILLSFSAAVDCGKPALSEYRTSNMAGSVPTLTLRTGSESKRGGIRTSSRSSSGGNGTGNKAGKPPTREPRWEIMFEHFSMKQAPKINRILIWGILPVLTVAYWLMYYYLKSEYDQWYAYFVSRQAEIFVLSWLTYYGFKGTKHAGIATAVMILSGFELIAEILDINTKGSIFDVAWKLVISVLLFYAFRHYYRHARQQ